MESHWNEDGRQSRRKWMNSYRSIFRHNNKIVIESLDPFGNNLLDIIALCPLKELKVELRNVDLTKYRVESWSRFCRRITHLKLHRCIINCSTLVALLSGGRRLLSLRLVWPKIDYIEICTFYLLAGQKLPISPTVTMLTFCSSDLLIFEPLLTILLTHYPGVDCLKIHLEMDKYRAPRADSKGHMITDLEPCKLVLRRLTQISKQIKSIDLKLTDGSPSNSCSFIPVSIMLQNLILKNLTKIAFHLHEYPGKEFFNILPEIESLRTIKWSINFAESGSYTQNICAETLRYLNKLYCLKIVHTRRFLLNASLLRLFNSSPLQKLHIAANEVCVDGSCGASSLLRNYKLHELKIQVNQFSPAVNQIEQITNFMRIFLEGFPRLRILHCSPVRAATLQLILKCQKTLEELGIELFHCEKRLFVPTSVIRKPSSSIHFKNLLYLSITDFDSELDSSILPGAVHPYRIHTLRLFGDFPTLAKEDKEITKCFKMFPSLRFLHLNSNIFMLNPFLPSSREICSAHLNVVEQEMRRSKKKKGKSQNS